MLIHFGERPIERNCVSYATENDRNLADCFPSADCAGGTKEFICYLVIYLIAANSRARKAQSHQSETGWHDFQGEHIAITCSSLDEIWRRVSITDD